MKDRSLNHTGNICAVQSRSGILSITGGKANLIIDNYVYSTTRVKRTGLRHIQGFHDDALP